MHGLCQCGCQQPTNIAKYTDISKGWTKGEPLRFLKGHNVRANSASNSERARGRTGLSSHGYVRVNVDPGKRAYEHVLVMEKMLGRKLKFFGIGHADNEIVHHIDGDKTNNSPDNLALMTHGAHCTMHKPRKGTGRGKYTD